MNYRRIYDLLITRGKDRPRSIGYERHHIIPRCLGGSNDVDNLTTLTPEEHYVAHQLLVKIYPDNHALAKAVAMMLPGRPSNKMYGWVRRRLALAKSVEQTGIGNSQFGSRWIHNPITKESKKLSAGTLEDGWAYGRYKHPKKERTVRKENRKKQTELYRSYHDIYKKVGFDKFVAETGYDKSRQNLVQQFARLLEEFIPQNGRKRYFPR